MPAPAVGTPTVNSKWRVDVDLDTTNYNGNWAQLKGLSNFVPAVNDTVQDATDYDTDGWGSDAITQRKHASTGTVMRKRYSGSPDPAQELLRTAADSKVLVRVRWYERVSGGEAYEGYVLVQWSPQGGDAPGLATVNITLLGQGPRTAITNPSTGTVLPVVNSVAPASGPTAGGTLVTITGSGFTGTTGATGVRFAAVNATSYTVVSDSKIVAVSPATTAGAKDVTVTTPAGVSAVNAPATTYTYV